MTGYDLQLHLRYRIAFGIKLNRNKILFMQTLPVSFTGSYTKNEPNFPWQNNLNLKKMVAGIDKVLNFKDFSRPIKKIKYFSRTFTDFKDFSRRQILLNFKTFSTLYKPW